MEKITDKSENWLIKYYLFNAAKNIEISNIDGDHEMLKWIIANQKMLNIPLSYHLNNNSILEAENKDTDTNATNRKRRKYSSDYEVQQVWLKWIKKYEALLNATKPLVRTKIEDISLLIGKLCELPEFEIAVLTLLAMCDKYNFISRIAIACENNRGWHDSSTRGIHEDHFSAFTGIKNDLDPDEDLKIEDIGFIKSRGRNYVLSKTLRDIYETVIDNEEKLKLFLYGDHSENNLEIDDFSYVNENIYKLKKLLISHKRTDEKPLNIFIYGSPGTGKTEFAKTLGKVTGRKVHFICEQDKNKADVTRKERISALTLISSLKDDDETKLLVVDEADEILSDINSNSLASLFGFARSNKSGGSKIFLNRLLENLTIPVIWIINEHRQIDEAVLRRMNYCLEFPKPPLEVRNNIIAKLVSKNEIKMQRGDIETLALYDTSPAYIENAIRLGKSFDGNFGIVKQILENNISASGKIKKTIAPKDDFKIELSNANTDLIALKDRVKACNSTKLTFCFSGVPGTGKSEYARFLAKEMGYEILYKRYSDLSSKWLGETEQNIAAAFREATQKRAFLILDEADSLLMRRENAHRSWEVTQVNEFLTQIESHEYPFAITTNAFDNLDTAAMRRFLFKVKFDAMEREQIKAAFQHFFNKPAPNELLRNENLTPADFALIRNQAQILGIENPQDLAQMIIEEAATRGGIKQRIGF